MGRPRLYQRADVVKKACDTFWAKGYQATTVQDLLDRMEMNRGSLYAGFTDKRSLFVECLRFYQQEVTERTFKLAQRPESGLETIRAFFKSIVEHAQRDRDKPGCLVTNTVAELGTLDAGLHEDLRRALQSVEGFFADALGRAQLSGEVHASVSVPQTARFLMGLTEGVHLVGKLLADPGLLEDIVNTGLKVLDRPPMASAAD